MKTKKNKLVWFLGCLGFLSSAERLMQAAQAGQPLRYWKKDCQEDDSSLPQLGELQETMNILNQQLSINEALKSLRDRYGDDVVKRLILKFDGEHLQVIGIQKDSPDLRTAKQPTTE